MVSVGKSKVILFQISSNYWQQRQKSQNASNETIYVSKKSNSGLCEIYQEEDNQWNISAQDHQW